MKKLILALLCSLPFFACSVSVETVGAQDEPTMYRGMCEERVPGEWWATVEVPDATLDDLSRAGVVLDIPAGAGASMGLDPSFKFYRAELVAIDNGRVDVWCGDSFVSQWALVTLP